MALRPDCVFFNCVLISERVPPLCTQDGNTPLHIARKKYCLEAAAVLESHDQTALEVKNKVSSAAYKNGDASYSRLMSYVAVILVNPIICVGWVYTREHSSRRQRM